MKKKQNKENGRTVLEIEFLEENMEENLSR